MSSKTESQGLRDSAVAGSSASGAWDPYEVWLTRVKQPREGQAGAVQTSPAPAAQAPPAIKVASSDLSETARLRALTLHPSR